VADNTDPGWKRNGRNGPLDWWLACEQHGHLWRSNCLSFGIATDHNAEFAQKLAAEVSAGAPLPSQASLESPRVDMPPGLTDGEKRAFMLGVAAGSARAALPAPSELEALADDLIAGVRGDFPRKVMQEVAHRLTEIARGVPLLAQPQQEQPR
jgi:hypothetical protein